MKNNFSIVDSVIHVNLQHKGKPLVMRVSIEDMPKLEAYPNTIYAKYDKSVHGYYAIGKLKQKPFIFHRYLMDFPEGLTVDHINHNTLDNRRENLRAVTVKENNMNRKGAYSTSKTGVKNIFFCNTWKRYIIEKDKKKYGRFKTLEEAKERLKELQGNG